jgi:hypothetical protein
MLSSNRVYIFSVSASAGWIGFGSVAIGTSRIELTSGQGIVSFMVMWSLALLRQNNIDSAAVTALFEAARVESYIVLQA